MQELSDIISEIARASSRRDLAAIEFALDGLTGGFSEAVSRGRARADREAGRDSLPRLVAPDPVTIHDLPSRDGIEIYKEGGHPDGSRKFRERKAA